MGVNTKTIKNRIKSIGSTKKITKAMEMISAVKMRKAVANVLATRSYADLAWKILKDISGKTDINLHPLLKERFVKKEGIIFITSNRGLAGGFSSKLLQELNNYIIKEKNNGVAEVEIILLGTKGRKIFTYFGHKVVSEFEKIDLTTKVEEILPMARTVVGEYINEKYDKLSIAYTDFFSPVKQIARIKQLLPLSGEDNSLGATDSNRKTDEVVNKKIEFKFEPDPKAVLDMLLPRLTEMQIYQAILESDASEHSARMLAMRNASDAAEDIIKELNYTFNKARQSAITQEIAEIVGGVAALE